MGRISSEQVELLEEVISLRISAGDVGAKELREGGGVFGFRCGLELVGLIEA